MDASSSACSSGAKVTGLSIPLIEPELYQHRRRRPGRIEPALIPPAPPPVLQSCSAAPRSGDPSRPLAMPAIKLERVVIVGKRAPVVGQLPRVIIEGRRTLP